MRNSFGLFAEGEEVELKALTGDISKWCKKLEIGLRFL